jgi:hypothetical protein
MTDFSQDPQAVLDANVANRYVGLHIQQGVPILDRDLNLLQDLVAATVRSIVSRYIGSGVPAGSAAFQVVERAGVANDFTVTAGDPTTAHCLVDGTEVTIITDLFYRDQRGVDALHAPGPTEPAKRTDTVYLDVFLQTVEADPPGSPAVIANNDIGVQTSVRLLPAWVVRVGAGLPRDDQRVPGHAYYPLAMLRRVQGVDIIPASAIEDLRKPCIPLPEIRDALLAPVITNVFPDGGSNPVPAANAQAPLSIAGRHFDFGVPTVRFDTTAATVDPKTVTASAIPVKVPGQAAGSLTLFVTTRYGTASIPFRVLS